MCGFRFVVDLQRIDSEAEEETEDTISPTDEDTSNIVASEGKSLIQELPSVDENILFAVVADDNDDNEDANGRRLRGGDLRNTDV